MRWIRIFTQETFSGTTFHELDLETRGLWFSLLVMAGLPPTDGVVELRKGVPYEKPTLASLLNCTTKRLNAGLRKLAEVGKITDDDGFIHIANWKKYQTRYQKYYAGKNGSDMPQNQHTENAAGGCQTDVEVEVEEEGTTVVHSETSVQAAPLLPKTVVAYFKRRPNGHDEQWEFEQYVAALTEKHGAKVVERAMRAFARRAASGGIAYPASYMDELMQEPLKDKRVAEAQDREQQQRDDEERERLTKELESAKRALVDEEHLRERAKTRAWLIVKGRGGVHAEVTDADWEQALVDERERCERMVAEHDDGESNHRDTETQRKG